MRLAVALVLAGLTACGPVAADRRPRTTSPDPSPPAVLTIPTSPDPQRPFQHASEVSIAARNGHVVVASINIHTDGDQTLAAAALLRNVGVAVSHDFGDTFGATVDPGLVAAGGTETSDPVVRAEADGTFWLSAVVAVAEESFGSNGMLLRSRSEGRTWDAIHPDLPFTDKEWLATTADGGLVLGANGGLWRFDAAGTVQASWVGGPDWPVMGAYADARGAHFLLQNAVALWTGDMTFKAEGLLAGAAFGDWEPGWSIPIGPTGDGGSWAIYERHPLMSPPTEAVVELRLFADGDTAGVPIPISEPGVAAFMPAAALDGDGRIHVIWYESSGAQGVLKYARSIDRDPSMGFAPARIVDPDACPGQGWIPQYGGQAPDRRLREYVDLAIDGRRVHAAWTHAPTLPSRIYSSHWDF